MALAEKSKRGKTVPKKKKIQKETKVNIKT